MNKLKTKHFTILFLGILFFSISYSFLSLQSLSLENNENFIEVGNSNNLKASDISFNSILNASMANASFFGEHSDDESGRYITGVGDVNNDGYDDFLIAAYKNDDFGYNTGKAYLFYGGDSIWSRDTNCSNANASFYGESTSNFFGGAVSTAGDMNNDTYDDFLIAAHANDDGGVLSGKAYLFYGGESIWDKNTNCSNANASFYGESASNQFGGAVSTAGDVNNDEYDDFLVSATKVGVDSKTYVGKAYLFYGGESIWESNMNCSNANASFIGESSTDHFGDVLSAAGDVNNDAYDDFLIGTDRNDEGADSAGQTYLFFGGDSIWLTDMSCTSANGSFIGQNEDESSGCSIAGAGNFNNDEYADFLIGAEGYDGNEIGESNVTGRIYVFLGAPSGWKMDTNCSKANLTIMGKDKTEYFGSSVAFIGDINNDGTDDILGGAYQNSDEAEKAGKVYLFVGNNYNINPGGNGDPTLLIPGYDFYFILGILGFSSIILTVFKIKRK